LACEWQRKFEPLNETGLGKDAKIRQLLLLAMRDGAGEHYLLIDNLEIRRELAEQPGGRRQA